MEKKDDFRWISAFSRTYGGMVDVRSMGCGDTRWVGRDGFIYDYKDLDFSKGGDVSSQADLSAVAVDERRYWRKLCGDVFLKLLDCDYSDIDEVLDDTERAVAGLRKLDDAINNESGKEAE